MVRSFCRFPRVWTSIVLLIGAGTPRDATAANRLDDQAQVDQLVAEALHREIYGADAERSRLLEQALKLDSDHEQARWQSGYIRQGRKWVHADEPPVSAGQASKWRAYCRQRDRSQDNADAELDLANWCRQSDLPDQERAHLNRVIQLQPGHSEARRRLGFQRMGGRWVPTAQLWSGVDRTRQVAASLEVWEDRLMAIAEGLRSDSPLRQDAARKRLREIDDAAAIPAIEMRLAADSQAAGLAVVESLGEMTQYRASAALARLSVMSPWPEVRVAAAEQLQSRPFDHYVPGLLTEMSAPIESRFQAAMINGQIVYRHAFVREGKDQQDVMVLDKTYDRRPQLIRTAAGSEFIPLSAAQSSIEQNRAVARAQAMADIRQTAMTREAMRLQQNALIQTQNERIGLALATATGQDIAPVAEAWWEWWDRVNEVALLGEKEANVQYAQERVVYESLPILYDGPSDGVSDIPQPRRCECFVAGTPVWTMNGPVAIETVQVGDMVLAQDPASGELAYKPVLDTSVRPAERLVRVQTEVESLIASGGHPLWVSGDGWVNVRQLTSGMQLHGLRAAIHVSDIEDGPVEPTYNLVVDGFHTYFVGKGRVLCHDNTERKPLNTVVPGH